jgi:curved DNA-binding protein CbpA
MPADLATLGLAWPCHADDVLRVYRGLALRLHPDRGGDAGEFARVNAAYQRVLAFYPK